MFKMFTERLVLRDHQISDLESHHELMSSDTGMKFILDLKTSSLEESRKNLLFAIDEITNPERKLYAFRIENKTTGEFIGEIGYTVNTDTPFGKLVHLGYFILEKHWNRGYITEAVKRVLRFAFEENNVYRISTGCFSENAASEKVMQKCGFIKEAEFKEIMMHEGVLKDRLEYRILKHEYEASQSGV